MQRRYLLAVVLLPFAFVTTRGQIAGVETPVCNAQFAQLLVQQQVMESKSVVEPVKRIKILLRSADFLWKFDQPTARAYFSEAWKMADDRFKETGFEKKNAGGKTPGITTLLPDQRMEVIRAIAKRDATWAKKLSEQMLADYEKTKDGRDSFDETRELDGLLLLAQQSVKTDPELTRHLVRRAMQYPLYNNWFFLFYGIAKESPSLADALYAEALQNYRNETPRRLLFLSAYPFANERVFGIDKYQIGTSLPANPVANPAFQRQFLITFFNRIASFATSEEDINRPPDKYYQPEPVYMFTALREIEPVILERFPDLFQRFSTAKGQAASLMNADMQKALADKEKYTGSLGQSFAERLAAVEKADEEGKLTDKMVVNLVTWGTPTEEQFVQILPWLDKISEENPRKETIAYFWFLRAKLAVKEKRFDDAEKYTGKVPEAEHRAILMFDIAAAQAKSESDMPNLFDTLNRLSKITRSSDNSVSKAQILLGLANMYERVNHSVALDELAESIRVTNSLKDPDIFSTTIRRQIMGKGFGFYAMLSTPGYDLEKTFEELSKKDFEMSLSNAKALDDKYFRTLAVIAVAGNCAKNAKPAPKPKQ
ncbi:MAG TPA: hypothetical protein PLL77_13055 [Pyrinomonadaceae bacterium]|nr:hypothetical protein [Pyrinomonadaceae bacterium]